MNILKKTLLSTVTLVPFFLIQPVSAHVIWFEQINNNQQEILFGHPEESQPEPLNIAKFKEATAYDSNKSVIPSTTLFENGRLFVNTNSPASALTAFYDNGFWRRNPDGSYDNISRQEAEAIGYANVTQFVKYAKGLSAWNNVLAQPFGLPLEIIALQNPFGLKEGDNLPIQVFFKGTLIDNPLVEYLGQTISIDSNGIALIPVAGSGLQVIEASYTDPNSNNPPISYAATFTAQSVPESGTLGFLGATSVLGMSQVLKRLIVKN
jgi:nickel transport protein